MRKVAASSLVAFAVAVATRAHAQGFAPTTVPADEIHAGETPEPARPMSFEEAVRRAIAHNPNTETALHEIQRAEALVEQSRSGYFPQLTANAIYTRLDADRALGDRVIQASNSLSANLTLTVPLVAPRAWVAHARRKDDVDIARLSAEDTKREVALATGRAYLNLVVQKLLLDASRRARDTARAHEDFAKERLAGGIGNRLDAVRASQERATSESQLQSQIISVTRAQEALGVLVGEPASIDVDVTTETQLGATPTLAAALGEIGAKRADVVAQRERVEVARKAVRDSYAEYLPVLAAVGQPFYQNPSTLTLPTTGWQAQLVFSLPIYDGGNRNGLTDERRVVHEEQKTRLDAVLRQARSEVRVAFEAVHHADESLAQAREAAKLAHEALDLAQLAYRAGATSNLEVIDAERRARDADTAAVVAEGIARLARLDLLAACGRFP
jgi:outer membrane protein TolC